MAHELLSIPVFLTCFHWSFPSLTATTTVLAADCFSSGNNGFSAAQFQQVANQVCSVGPDAQIQFGTTGFPFYWPRIIQGHYEGTAKVHCRVRALDISLQVIDWVYRCVHHIISQCVVGSGRNGGRWDWSYNGVEAHYWIQGFN
ncbi:hypothetical protein BZA05DRAFT_433844 [Tricharina praecox]|uniref:uncharacterized protein n=1 Tax=Tricharina praecox TaxID=43433 RepID=UPI00221FAE2A|nr:uncharacterized protein BZA05DRAFT_433844 [Tricharina praecox]KAI5857236.1 hypothetical protein BZA05DRAFT_433844 [Tricharina praecox]